MSTDKTLADVQPGGRVRLGDQASVTISDELLTRMAYAIPGAVDTTDKAKEVAARIVDIYLSAQPSPGGQGDALLREVCSQLESLDCGACIGSDAPMEDLHGRIAAHLADRQPVGDQHPDDLAVDEFAAAMKAKMAEARVKGRGGWEDPAQCTAEDLSRMLRNHVEKGDPRDVANFCMMLHQRGEAIAARQPVCSNCDGSGLIPYTSGQTAESFEQGTYPCPDCAARQPVGEPVAYIEHFADKVSRMEMTVPGLHLGLGRHPVYANPPAQAVDLGAVRALLQRRIAQWRSHLPVDPGAPGTREIETKGEHDYNNDVRIYREGIAVMEEVLSKVDRQAVGNG